MDGFRQIVLTTAILTGGFSPTVLFAQVQPPPRHDSRSPTGVSYRGGGFSFEEEDLAVGDEATGLRLVRSYNSASDGISDPYLAAVGWTHSMNIYVSSQPLPQNPDDTLPQNYRGRCVYNVVGGGGSVGFVFNGQINPQQTGCGGVQAGPYVPITPSGDTLEYISGAPSYYQYVGADGSVINFTAGGGGRASNWTKPDGTILTFTYVSGQLKSVFTNRGWGFLFESASKICAVNLSKTYVTPTSPCPADAQTVTYTYTNGNYVSSWKLMTSATRSGATRTYGYSAANDHVNCIKDPGQSNCRIQNIYNLCPVEPSNPYPQPSAHLRDSVALQEDASGRQFSYTYSNPYSTNLCANPLYMTEPDYRPFSTVTTKMAETGVAGNTIAVTDTASQLIGLTDPLGRSMSFGYVGSDYYYYETGAFTEAEYPEGNRYVVTRDARGNTTSQRSIAKPGSGLADVTVSSIFPETCSDRKTCNKPTATTDARGGVTSFTYDPNHGGVLSEMGPAPVVNAARPLKLTTWVQRYVWIKNGPTSMAQAALPVWVKSTETQCQTLAGSNPTTTCDASATQMVTTYEYGADGSGDELMVKGVTVSSDGTTLRTCFNFDEWRRQISETKPRAGLANCT